MTDKLLIDRATIAQALEALELRCGTNAEEREPNGAITALRAALAQEQAGAWQDGVLEGHLRKRERWLAQEPEPVQEPACSCSLRGRLVGDGCEVCNPELAAELRQQPEPVQEPVAWMWKERVNGDFDSAWRVTRCEPPPYAIEQQPLYTAPTPRKPETEQEPVAWMVYTEGGTSAYVTDNPNDLVGAYRALALYTAPPQRPRLTDEEIAVIEESCMGLVQYGGHENMTQERVFDVLAFARAVERKVRGE